MTDYPDTLEARQKYFDKTAHYLSSMNRQAKKEGEPTYLGYNGSKCAIGFHIPDGHEAQQHQGYIGSLLIEWPGLDGVAIPEGTDGHLLASMLQTAHDNDDNWNPVGYDGYDHLQWVARECGLNDDAVRGYL